MKKLIISALLTVPFFISSTSFATTTDLSDYYAAIEEETKPDLLVKFGKTLQNKLGNNETYLSTFLDGKHNLCISLNKRQDIPYYTFTPEQTKQLITYAEQCVKLIEFAKTKNLVATKELGSFKLGEFFSAKIYFTSINDNKPEEAMPCLLMNFYIEGDFYDSILLDETSLNEFIGQLKNIEEAIKNTQKIEELSHSNESLISEKPSSPPTPKNE